MKTSKKTIILSIALFLAVSTIIFILKQISNPITQSTLEYTVQKGDTCGKIAANLGVSAISIIESNNLNPDCNINVGQLLIIPYPTIPPLDTSVVAQQNTILDCEHTKYSVREGDTIEYIAKEYNISVEAISSFNGLIGDKVFPGTELVIPLCDTTTNP